MKIIISFKDPDTVSDSVQEAVRESVEAMGLSEDEAEAVYEKRLEKTSEIVNGFFEYGEYCRVEVDTEKRTAIVLKPGS